MKRLTIILFSLLLAAGVETRAEETNSTPSVQTNAVPSGDTISTPAQESNSFDLIVRRNIFDQSRTGIRRRNERPRAPRVERVILQGIAAGLGDAEAIFGGSSSSDRMLKVGDHLSGFKLSQITPDAVKLTDGTNTFVLDMEKRRSLRRTDDGPWEGSMETVAPPAVSTNAPDETASSSAPASDGAHPGETPIEKKTQIKTRTGGKMTRRNIIAMAAALLTTASAAFAQDDAASAKPPAADAAKDAPAAADTNLPGEPLPTNGIVLNFHEVPLNTVLNYLSAKAGLIIVSDANMSGNVSVVAKQPIGTNEIVSLLNQELAKNNLGAVLEGRTLQIMDLERIKSLHSTPVEVATNLASIRQSDEIVTEILPVVTLNPVQLVKDLDTLIPKGATVTANEAGGAVIMTASRRDVHRIAQIIGDLDSSSVSEVSVFVLKYADAKSVATELKEVFQSADSDVTRATTRNNFGGGRGGRGGGGFNPFGGGFGGGGGGGGNNTEESKNSQTHAVFVSDDQMNAVIASAPPSYMPSITNVIDQLDKESSVVTVIQVFPLKNADPAEIAAELGDLFPSTTSSDQNNRNMGFRFAPPWMRGGGGSENNKSERMKAQTSVIAVADKRTESVIVTASKDLMPEIKGMIDQLDQGRAGKTHVSAFPLDAADPASVQLTLTGLFMNTGTSSSTSSQTALSARGTANNNAQSSTSSTTTSGFGSGGSSALH